MQSEDTPKTRTLLSIEVEPAEKELFKRAAKSKRLTLSAWARTLMLDEARRLGVS